MARSNEIVSNPGLTRSALSRFSKAELVSAILQIRKKYAEYESGEFQARLREKEIELRALEARLAGSQTIAEAVLRYSDKVGDHQYGPMAVKSLSSAMSSVITGTDQTSPSDPDEPIPPDLAARVETALSQGMKWNKNNHKPDRVRTVARKLEEWEASIEKGRQADRNLAMAEGYDQLVAQEGEGFVVGLCESIELALNLKPQSSYLKVRFKKLAKIYGIKPVIAPTSTTSKEIAEDLVRRFLGEGLEPETFIRRVSKFEKWVEQYSDDLPNMDIHALRGIVCTTYLPVAFPLDKRPGDTPSVIVYQDLVNHKKYDPELAEFWAAYCKEKGFTGS